MKKIYLQSRDKKRWYNSGTLLGVLLVLAIIFSPARGYVAEGASYVVRPFWYAGEFIVRTADGVITEFTSKQTLALENNALKDNTTHLVERLNYLTTLQNENSDLKKLLSRSNDVEFSSTTSKKLCPPTESGIGARTILSPANSYYASLLIDVGSKDAVAKGDRVYSYGDVILGTISDVYPSMSRVVLYSAPKLSTTVFLGREHVSVSIMGDGDGAFTASLPKNVSVAVGDQALLPVSGPALVAIVQAVQTKGDAPFETIYLKSPTNLHALTWVYVTRKIEKNNITPCLDVTY